MRARGLVEEYPSVSVESDGLEAAQLLAQHRLPGLVVTAEDGHPVAILPTSQVVRSVVPQYVQQDPVLAGVLDEKASDQIVHQLNRLKVRDMLPQPPMEVAVVDANDTALEVAAVMARLRCPLVAVVENGRLTGVVTASRLLEYALNDSSAT